MKTRFVLVFTIVVLLGFNKSFAQAGGLNFTLGFPMGEFKEELDRMGFGLSGHFLFLAPTANRPFGFGLNIGYLNYGQESRREPFSSTIPDVTVDVERSNNLVNFHVLFQLGFGSGPIRPFVEGLFGGSYIFTETTIRSRGSEEVASSNNFDDFAWNYGAGGGFLILLHTEEEGSDFGSLFLDLKARYLFGSEAEYLKEGSVIISNGHVTYQVSKSKTDLLTVHAGVVAYFNSVFN
ncbi:MAG: hypothetical protein HXY50_12965 [Ignavibacteriaceae bacterium]|nr:hypothetical protein [Ignavibacteriaceae bacterium]